MRLLLVEDDPMMGEVVRQGLRQEGYAVDWVNNGRDAGHALAMEPYELMLLDLGLPGQSGLDLLRARRAAGDALPVLILTARDTVDDRVRGLDAGADDYLVKPFDMDELAARVRALLRRRAGRKDTVLAHQGLVLDPAAHVVDNNGRKLRLSAREFALLAALMESPGAVLSRAQLEQRLYGWDEEVDSNAVEVHIHHLRRKIGTWVIRNVRGVGYMLGERP